ncbi:MAG: electron transfer flavoprotein beta subunit/FixA family protein, partial [Tannerellaceae bacterium]
HAKTVTEKQEATTDYTELFNLRPYLDLQEWSVTDVNADVKLCGLSGSPTKVKKIESVIFQAKESKTLAPTDSEIEELMKELIANHTIG